MVRQTMSRFRSHDFSRNNVSGPWFSSWFKPDGNYCFSILDGHYQGSWTQSDLTRRWFSTLITIFWKTIIFSWNSRWPFQGQNDQFSKNFAKFRKITELEKVIYLCASWPYTHHYTSLNAKVTLDFRNFHEIFYHLVTQKLRQNLYKKKYFIFKICYEKHFYCSLYDGGGIFGGPVSPVIPGPGGPV